jgi:hypothetical protein
MPSLPKRSSPQLPQTTCGACDSSGAQVREKLRHGGEQRLLRGPIGDHTAIWAVIGVVSSMVV